MVILETNFDGEKGVAIQDWRLLSLENEKKNVKGIEEAALYYTGVVSLHHMVKKFQ